MKNGSRNGSGGTWLGGVGEGSAVGETARATYYDQLARTCDALRTLVDEFGETLRRSRGVAPIDRGPTDREVALQLRLTATTFTEVADALAPAQHPPRLPEEVTTETKRIRRRAAGTDEDSSPGRK